MNEETPRQNPGEEFVPAAEVRTKRSFSIIWVVPLVALVIGGWLAYKALSEKGPTITIAFEDAQGLEAGKTTIKYKNIEVGQITDIRISDNLALVVCTAEMQKGAEPYLTDKTRFWVVRARVQAGEVSGLGTLFSGAYIGIDPHREGKPQREFVGLEVPPVLTTGQQGRHFTLRSPVLGSLSVGTQVHYRGMTVGQVVSYEYDPERDDLKILAFVKAPFDKKINTGTRFYNASGIDVVLNANGLQVRTGSLVSVLLGAITFETPASLEGNTDVPDDYEFRLYPDQESTKLRVYRIKKKYLLYFQDDVRGLTIGAPVEYRGITIGSVVDFTLEFDWKSRDFKIPVLIELEPERIEQVHGKLPEGKTIIDEVVARGMRAQLKTGNLITGQKYIDFDFHRDAPPAKVLYNEAYPVIPTIPQPLQQLIISVQKVLDRLEKVPTDEIGREVKAVLASLNENLHKTDAMFGKINDQVLPELSRAMQRLEKSIASIETGYGKDSGTNLELRRTLEELTEAARSIRILTDYLERHPESLIRGKDSKE